MNQAISNALLFNLVIIFVIILIAFFIGSMSYSKASKVNNRIVEEIEKQAEGSDRGRHQPGYDNTKSTSQVEIIDKAYENAACDILTWLDKGDDETTTNTTGIGYRKVGNNKRSCPEPSELDIAGTAELVSLSSSGKNRNGTECIYSTNPYEYCVYKVNECEENATSSCYTYYHVITYMYFDVPIISDLVRIPVHGETMGFRIKNS